MEIKFAYVLHTDFQRKTLECVRDVTIRYVHVLTTHSRCLLRLPQPSDRIQIQLHAMQIPPR